MKILIRSTLFMLGLISRFFQSLGKFVYDASKRGTIANSLTGICFLLFYLLLVAGSILAGIYIHRHGSTIPVVTSTSPANTWTEATIKYGIYILATQGGTFIFGLISVFFAWLIFGRKYTYITSDEAGIACVHSSANTNFTTTLTDEIRALPWGRIDIADTWLWGNDPSRTVNLAVKALSDAVKNGIEVNIVMMHPNSPAAIRRELIYGTEGDLLRLNQSRAVRENIRISLQKLADIRKGLNDKAKLRVFCLDAALTMQVYQFPHKAFLGFYGATGPSFCEPQLEINAWPKTEFSQMIKDYMEKLRIRCGLENEPMSDFIIEVDLTNTVVDSDNIRRQETIMEFMLHTETKEHSLLQAVISAERRKKNKKLPS